MADVSNLKIYSRSNLERLNLRDTKIGNKYWEIGFMSKANMRIYKIAVSAGYQMDGQFQNCPFLEPNFGFANWKISLFVNFSI